MKPISPPFSNLATSARGAPPQAAMVFAAGLGTRMRPLTDVTPKPLVCVNGKSLIDYTLDDLASVGVERAIVNLHHLADQIETHLAARAAPRIVLSDERALLLDQGGGVKKALAELGDAPFFICNTDAFWRDAGADNLRRLAALWRPEEMDVALLLAPTKGGVGVDWDGDFDLAADGRILRRDGAKPYVYSGVGIVKPQLFANVAEDVFRLAPFFFEAGVKGRLFGVVGDGLWLHVGSVAAIAEAEARLAASAA
jgi:N-acetyl-alpha-D-muramate 1-phosphate uridylyltransferase